MGERAGQKSTSGGDRTHDHKIKSLALYHLSYGGFPIWPSTRPAHPGPGTASEAAKSAPSGNRTPANSLEASYSTTELKVLRVVKEAYDEIRTRDLSLTKRVLCQLSYVGKVENPGFDPGASSLLTTHSTD